MTKILIIGAGGVGRVVAHKCAQLPAVFTDIVLASRTQSKCEQIAAEISERLGRKIATAQVDADNVPELVALLNEVKPALVINVALPYQDLTIMDACLEAGVNYLDTANYEPLDTAKFEYSWQWAYQEKFEKAGLMALLGSGFDPGATNVFTAYLQKHCFDEIHTITATRSRLISIPRLTSAKLLPSAGTGKTASSLRRRRCPRNVRLPVQRAWARITFTACITKNSSRSQSIYPRLRKRSFG